MIKTQNRQVIEMGDWDDLVTSTYGRIYNFQQQDDCKERQQVYLKVPSVPYDHENDTVPEVINGEKMGVSFKAWLARDPNEWNGKKEDKLSLDLFWERNFYPDVSMVANDLHAKGLLPAGEYYIDINW